MRPLLFALLFTIGFVAHAENAAPAPAPYPEATAIAAPDAAPALAPAPLIEASPMNAAPAPQAAAPAPFAAPPEQISTDLQEKPRHDAPDARLSFGPDLGIVRNRTLFGVDIGVDGRISQSIPLYVGIVTGFQYYGISGTSTITGYPASAAVSVVPLLASAVYRFEVSSTVHTLLGVSAGIAFLNGQQTDGWFQYSNSTTVFEGLVRPGLEVAVAPSASLVLEPRLGVLNQSFYLNPTVGFALGF